MYHLKHFICLSLLLPVTSGLNSCRSARSVHSNIEDVSVVGGTLDKIGVELTPANGQTIARFFYSDNGRQNLYKQRFEGDVIASQNGSLIKLSYRNVDIGVLEGNELRLCDRFKLSDGQDVTYSCSAIFWNPGLSPSPTSIGSSASSRFEMDLSLAAPTTSTRGVELTDETITLEQYAQNQINQYGTGTCAFNAATGIMEIMSAIATGQAIDLSEPYYLAYTDSTGRTEWFWEQYDRIGTGTTTALSNNDLPVKSIYKPGVSFEAAIANADGYFRANGGNRIQYPAGMRGEKIFFNASYSNWVMSTGRDASDADYDATTRWFQANRRPINLHYWANTYWHSVVMIGYNPATDEILVKDSLGNTHLKGTWKSRQWFKNYAYGAVGVTDSQAVNPMGSGAVPPPVNPAVGPVVNNPGSGASGLSASDFRVGVTIGYQRGRMREFTMRIQASPQVVSRIERVVYNVHETFGDYAVTTATSAQNSFSSILYMTYANGWTTRGTTVYVRTPTGTQAINLPGTRISW